MFWARLHLQSRRVGECAHARRTSGLPYRAMPATRLAPHGAKIGGAKLWYDQSNHRFYLLVSLTIVTPDPTPATLSEVVGVDLGQRYLADADHAREPHRVLPWKAGESESRPLRSTAKTAPAQRHSLGHPATHRHRPAERRFKLSTNHTIAKQLQDTHPKSLIGLEDLTGNRSGRNVASPVARTSAGPVSPKARRRIECLEALPNCGDC